MNTKNIIEKIDFSKLNGLVPVIIQDIRNREIRMVGFSNKEAIRKTLTSGKATFWSRTRKKLWTKGETSGNFLEIVDIIADCDYDSLLYKVIPHGPTCHTGKISCFHNMLKSLKNRYIIERADKIFSESVLYNNIMYNSLNDFSKPLDSMSLSLFLEYLSEKIDFENIISIITPKDKSIVFGSILSYLTNREIIVIDINNLSSISINPNTSTLFFVSILDNEWHSIKNLIDKLKKIDIHIDLATIAINKNIIEKIYREKITLYYLFSYSIEERMLKISSKEIGYKKVFYLSERR